MVIEDGTNLHPIALLSKLTLIITWRKLCYTNAAHTRTFDE